jgi:hypothetical protein
MSTSHAVLKLFRKLHLYIGLFISPALLFFAFTGALQSVNLHESTQGSSYKPPAWLAAMAHMHKKQTTVVPVRRPRPAEGAVQDRPGQDRAGRTEQGKPGGHGKPGDNEAMATGGTGPGAQTPASVAPSGPPPKGHWPMKIFFVVVSLGLFISTLTGVYMSYRYTRNKLAVTGWLVAGTVLPLLLLPF